MKMTQDDYEQRAARIENGTATDDDRRLVELYEREGYTRGTDAEPAALELVATGEAEVIKGEDKPRPAKATRRRGNGTEGQTK